MVCSGESSEVDGIPDTVVAHEDDSSNLSPMESPLAGAGNKYNARLINEHIKMIQAGMTPEEIIALFEQT
eukprot:CAMPEP_0194216490 /NCGR_PEP_ID=MMETSP0156-20130528/19091_1 /TAXON_ID=33649 /ORGANISM="Thalassionema nitzschioides, Strain L26-B" /LENGTH=69 /DNA_ID=CAMNT_0038945275 /DNA_START=37 /DNA_END=242 /DNA_ORIENTATION=+